MYKNVFAIALMWLTISPMVLLFPSNFPIYVFFCLKYITLIWFSLAILNMEGFRPPFFFLHWSSELELKKKPSLPGLFLSCENSPPLTHCTPQSATVTVCCL